MRSDRVKAGFERAPHRSLMRATGMTDEDLSRPFIAICNSFNEVIPGHVHLNRVAALIKEEVRKAGGTPVEFNLPGVCDGIAMGHGGMKFSLASRELIADSVETMLSAHAFDAMICIPNCDKIVPGMIMGALRCNIPTIFCSGGPMAAGMAEDGTVLDLNSVFEAVARFKAGKINEAELHSLECRACPGAGSCSGMFTANSMNCLSEVIGLALPGNGSLLATSEERKEFWKQTARRAVEMAKADGPLPRDIVTRDAIDNAFTIDMAMGGSSNTVLHTLAIAREAGVEYDLQRINDISRRTPNICKVAPSSRFHMQDVLRAGGVSAIIHEIARIPGALHLDAMTVSGKTLGETVEGCGIADETVIHPLENAYSRDGGLAILFGNLAEEGAVVKKGSFWDYLVVALSILLISVPNLVFALLLQQVFAGKLGWFPVIGWPSDHLWTSGWNYTVLPTLAGCFGYIASYARLLKASMLDVMNQDYILTAESKGLTHREVILHHVLRNSFIPIVTNLPMSVAMCITGSFFIESVFSIPGLGLYYVNAVAAQDVTIVMGETVILAALYIIVVFVTDILYTVVDPRIRIRGGKR